MALPILTNTQTNQTPKQTKHPNKPNTQTNQTPKQTKHKKQIDSININTLQ
jgi:hypothetical protein